jgi:transposase InsO family protein
LVKAISDTISAGLSQKRSCLVIELQPRLFRRWLRPSARPKQTAWNKLTAQERSTMIDLAWTPQFIAKPVSHLYVHGHESGAVYASLSSWYRVLDGQKTIRPKIVRHCHRQNHVSIHELMDAGFRLTCLDATRILTDANVSVWGIPVLLLPCRYILHIGYAVHSFCSGDVTDAMQQASALIPDSIQSLLVSYTDRGSSMKSSATKNFLKNKLNIPAYFGRPHTPEDQAWIESLIGNLKHHRDVPSHFPQVADVVDWLKRFPDIHNNEPHSSLGYVTPTQALLGKMEVILKQRKQNLCEASQARRAAFLASKSAGHVGVFPVK